MSSFPDNIGQVDYSMKPSVLFEDVVMYKSVGVGTPQRPSLADQQKIGFFSLDRGSQTDVTEVLDLKEMTEVIQILLQDVETLRKDINVTKHVMKADYESKLMDKSLELYCRINEKVADLEKMHDDRIKVIRKAYRQQLSDAISRVAVLYDKNLERKISREKRNLDRESGKKDEKYRELQNQIQKNEQVIHMLQLQLQQYQQNISNDQMLEEESVGSMSPPVNHEAEELREQLAEMEKKIKRVEDQYVRKSEDAFKIAKDLAAVKEQLQREKNLVIQLQNDKLEMKQSMDNDKASNKRMADRQKKEMERMLEERLKQALEEMNSAADKKAKEAEEMENKRIKELIEHNKQLEELLLKEKNSKPVQKPKKEIEEMSISINEEKYKAEIVRLKKEIEKIHRTWEKKFAILQQSLHALKDESYLRQTLQRQAANLHHAAVSYAVDSPAGIVPAKIPSPNPNSKKPLPDIPRQVKRSQNNNCTDDGGEKDYLSYTISAPSGRGTTIVSVDENQVMSDEEDLPTDVKPLPLPPQPTTTEPSQPLLRSHAESNEVNGRPSTVSHVVVLPSAEL